MGNDIASFVVNSGLYDRITITEQNIQQLISVVKGAERIDVYCPHCKEKRVFNMHPVIVPKYKDSDNNSAYVLSSILASEQQLIANSRRPGPLSERNAPLAWTWKKHSGEGVRIFVLKCYCAMDEEHRLDYIMMSENDDLIKIGQFPSVADLSFPELRMYKKVVSVDDMRELRRAIGLHAQGIGVGAFVYLRRILERMVVKVMNEAIAAGTVNDDVQYQKFGDKIKMLQGDLPDILCSNPLIYGVLSKGVHELSDDECIRCFPVVKQCIVLMLDEWEEKRRKKEAKAELEKALASFASSL